MESRSTTEADNIRKTENQCSVTVATSLSTISLTTSSSACIQVSGVTTQPCSDQETMPRPVVTLRTDRNTGGLVNSTSNTCAASTSSQNTCTASASQDTCTALAGQDTCTASAGQNNQQVYSTDQSIFVTDKLGRQHYKASYTGPAAVFLRAAKFHSSTIKSHIIIM